MHNEEAAMNPPADAASERPAHAVAASERPAHSLRRRLLNETSQIGDDAREAWRPKTADRLAELKAEAENIRNVDQEKSASQGGNGARSCVMEVSPTLNMASLAPRLRKHHDDDEVASFSASFSESFVESDDEAAPQTPVLTPYFSRREHIRIEGTFETETGEEHCSIEIQSVGSTPVRQPAQHPPARASIAQGYDSNNPSTSENPPVSESPETKHSSNTRNQAPVEKDKCDIDSQTFYVSSARWTLPIVFDAVLREGWLQKENSWSLADRRWFSVRKGELSYVRQPGDTRHRRIISLTAATQIHMSTLGKASFAIVIHTPGRCYHLLHSDRREVFLWMKAISEAAALALQPVAEEIPISAGGSVLGTAARDGRQRKPRCACATFW